jgi:dynactin 1
MFIASIGLTKTSVAAIIQEEGKPSLSKRIACFSLTCQVETVDMGGRDADRELFEPLQKLLDQCKSAKVLSK